MSKYLVTRAESSTYTMIIAQVAFGRLHHYWCVCVYIYVRSSTIRVDLRAMTIKRSRRLLCISL